MGLSLKFLFFLFMCTNNSRAKHSEILLHVLLVSIPLQDNIIKINLYITVLFIDILNSCYYSGSLFIDVFLNVIIFKKNIYYNTELISISDIL